VCDQKRGEAGAEACSTATMDCYYAAVRNPATSVGYLEQQILSRMVVGLAKMRQTENGKLDWLYNNNEMQIMQSNQSFV
jgi:hypothetical protein